MLSINYKNIMFIVLVMQNIFFVDYLKANDHFRLHEIILTQNSIENKKNLLQQALDEGQDINVRNSTGVTPLNLAIMYNQDPEIIKFLLQQKANVNIPDDFNVSPLHNAVKKSPVSVIDMLLQAGADVHLKNEPDNQTPFDLAEQSGSIVILELFKKYAEQIAEKTF
ncbi:MAG: ankyrin repeat domain-containing protein [Candidatus Chromulinivorax sp.]